VILQNFKDHALDNSSILRRIYGLKLTFFGDNPDAAKWFLHDHKKWDCDTPLKVKGLVLDVGAYKGAFTNTLLKVYPDLDYSLFEPIPRYAESLRKKYNDHENVKIFNCALSADGRNLNLEIAGLRSRNIARNVNAGLTAVSLNIKDIFLRSKDIELVKMNIEGMEYECLEELIQHNLLSKARYLLIQFHNFESDSASRRLLLQREISKDFTNIYCFDWLWELWVRKD